MQQLEITQFRSSDNDQTLYSDELFAAQISRAITESETAYSSMNFKAALKAIYFDLSNEFQAYLIECGTDGIKKNLYDKYIRTFLLCLSPIAPQFCDYVWRKLEEKESIVLQSYPVAEPYNPKLFWVERFLRKTRDNIGFALKKKTTNNTIVIFVRPQFSEFEKQVLSLISKNFSLGDEKAIVEAVSKEITEKPGVYMQFLRFYAQSALEFGSFVLDPDTVENQIEWIHKISFAINRQLTNSPCNKYEVLTTEDTSHPLFDAQVARSSVVYLPSVKTAKTE
uniref:Leucyl-tRNA synthetase n=1 Tax=Coptotermes formosanus TaxID=36987 RepID=R4UXC0_COPFO|nr:leucyl-tRNA synthetase [Coptotermes formosanus]